VCFGSGEEVAEGTHTSSLLIKSGVGGELTVPPIQYGIAGTNVLQKA
jgi:hypothetical protein